MLIECTFDLLGIRHKQLSTKSYCEDWNLLYLYLYYAWDVASTLVKESNTHTNGLQEIRPIYLFHQIQWFRLSLPSLYICIGRVFHSDKRVCFADVRVAELKSISVGNSVLRMIKDSKPVISSHLFFFFSNVILVSSDKSN